MRGVVLAAPRIAMTARTLIDALSARSPAALVIHGPRGSVSATSSWAEIDRLSGLCASRLASLGLDRRDRIGLMAETDLDFLRLFFGCQKAGLVPVPLPLPNAFGDRSAHAERLRLQLRAAGACVAISAEAHAGLLPPDLRMRGTPADIDHLAPSARVPRGPTPDDIAFLQFSSGSTRFPKGAMISQRAVMANAAAIRDGLGVVAGDVTVSWLPLYHDMGLVGCVLAPLAAGLELHLLPTREFVRNPAIWPRLMSDARGTLSYSPGFGYDLAARRAACEDLDLSRWRVAGIGGDMIRPDVLRRFADAFAPAGFRAGALVPSYGLAEATLAVTMTPPGRDLMAEDVDLDRLESEGRIAPALAGRRSRMLARCGMPLPGTELRIVDAGGRRLAEREVGRIMVRSPSVMEGYFREPEETARALDPSGWLDTGDLGAVVEGELVITGRAKDVIIVNGRNLWPQDLEWAAEQVRPLRAGDVAAVPHPGSDGGEQVVLLVQCRVPDTVQRDRLVEALVAQVMATSGVLCRVVLVPPRSLPRTSSGKLARAQARLLLAEGVFG